MTTMTAPPPMCEIIIPEGLPLAPPLYRWDDDLDDDTVNPPPVHIPSNLELIPDLPPRRPRRDVSPARGRPRLTLPSDELYNFPLKPLEFKQGPLSNRKIRGITKNKVTLEDRMAIPLRQVVVQERFGGSTSTTTDKNPVTILFAIRNTGCGQCIEHAMQLSQFVTEKYGHDQSVHMVGVIKPEPVPASQIFKFHSKYFNFPMYQDEDWNLFTNVLGDRKLGVWKLLNTFPRIIGRQTRKNIKNRPLGGRDVWTHGGLLILDPQGKLRFVYYEEYGEQLDLEAIAWAINQAKNSKTSLVTTTTTKQSYNDGIVSPLSTGKESVMGGSSLRKDVAGGSVNTPTTADITSVPSKDKDTSSSGSENSEHDGNDNHYNAAMVRRKGHYAGRGTNPWNEVPYKIMTRIATDKRPSLWKRLTSSATPNSKMDNKPCADCAPKRPSRPAAMERDDEHTNTANDTILASEQPRSAARGDAPPRLAKPQASFTPKMPQRSCSNTVAGTLSMASDIDSLKEFDDHGMPVA